MSVWERYAVIRGVDDQSGFLETGLPQLTEDQSYPLVHAADGPVLCGEINPGCRSVLHEIRYKDVIGGIVYGVPVGYGPHTI